MKIKHRASVIVILVFREACNELKEYGCFVQPHCEPHAAPQCVEPHRAAIHTYRGVGRMIDGTPQPFVCSFWKRVWNIGVNNPDRQQGDTHKDIFSPRWLD